MRNLELQGGLQPTTEDSRDLNLGAIINWPKLEELPMEFFIEPLSIKNQMADGNPDFCGSCAGTGMIEPKEGAELFYPFLFAAAKYESGQDPQSFGLPLRAVLKALQKWGVPEMRNVPDEVRNLDGEARRVFNNYPEVLREGAKLHCIGSYFAIKGPYDAYDNARAAMWAFRSEKQASILGVDWGWPLEMFELTGTPDGFGHALWHGGWYEHGIALVNSAGKEAGHEGKHSMSRETFNAFADKYGLYMVVDLPLEIARQMNDHGIKLGDSAHVAAIKAFISLWFPFLKRLWM